MHIGIIGRQYGGLKDYLEANSIEYTLFKDTKIVSIDAKNNTVAIDYSNPESVIQSVQELSLQKPLDGVLTFYERYIEITAEIANFLDLPGLSMESARACTNKFVMRTKFSQSSMKISPDFCIVNSLDDLQEFASNHAFPLILKPANLAKSLLVTKCHNLEELMSKYDATLEIIDRVYEKYAPNNERIIILEEFMEGSIHSVDAFIDSAGKSSILDSIVDYQTGYDIGYDDNFHYSRIVPSKLSTAEQLALREVATEGANALGMKNSAAHIEIIMTKDGPRIVEIGARNGGYRQRMHQLADGIDLYKSLISVTADSGEIDISPTKHEHCAVLELFPRNAGEFKGVNALEELQKLPSLNYLNIKYEVGEKIGLSSDGFKAAAVIALHNADEATFQKDLEFVNNNVSILV